MCKYLVSLAGAITCLVPCLAAELPGKLERHISKEPAYMAKQPLIEVDPL